MLSLLFIIKLESFPSIGQFFHVVGFLIIAPWLGCFACKPTTDMTPSSKFPAQNPRVQKSKNLNTPESNKAIEQQKRRNTNQALDKKFPTCIEVHGHRGARGVRPENTLAAFRYALKLGVNVLELDIQATKDDVLVVSHDPVINWQHCLPLEGMRSKGEIPIRSLSLDEVRRYDCGSLIDPIFKEQKRIPGEKIPTLKEVLTLLSSDKSKNLKVGLNIELKSLPARPDLSPSPEKFASLLIKLLRQHNMVNRTIVQSFDHRTLHAVRKLEPKISLAILTGKSTHDYARLLEDLKATIVSPNHLWITVPDVNAVHKSGGRIIPWTANKPSVWMRLINAGVDGIITDYPKRLIEFLKKRGCWCQNE